MRAKLLALMLTLTVLTGLALAVRAGPPPGPVTTNIEWRHYLDLGLPEQDVFIEVGSAHSSAYDPGYLGPRAIFLPNLFRVTAQRASAGPDLSPPLFAAAAIVSHDPFQLGSRPLGPFYKGEPLGFTLRQWLAARGSGTYTVTDGDAELNVAFEQLVPGGDYALWCGRLGAPPNYVELERACGAADGSQNHFQADALGAATLHMQMKALPAGMKASTPMLTLAYERDVSSEGAEWGGFGLTSHVQLLYVFPPPPAFLYSFNQ